MEKSKSIWTSSARTSKYLEKISRPKSPSSKQKERSQEG